MKKNNKSVFITICVFLIFFIVIYFLPIRGPELFGNPAVPENYTVNIKKITTFTENEITLSNTQKEMFNELINETKFMKAGDNNTVKDSDIYFINISDENGIEVLYAVSLGGKYIDIHKNTYHRNFKILNPNWKEKLEKIIE